METSERVSFASTSLRHVPFQLLPRVVYTPEKLEAGLTWQRNFTASLDSSAPRIAVIVQAKDEFSTKKCLESLAVQSYQPASVFVLLANDFFAEQVHAALSTLQLPGTVVSHSAELGSSAKLEPLLNDTAADYFCLLSSDTLLHPQALLILCKCIVRKHPEMIYSNEVTLSNDFETALQFFRRAPLDTLSVLSTNFYGDTIIVSREFAKRFVPSLALRSKSLNVLGWSLATHALAAKRPVEFIPLALVHKRYVTDLAQDEAELYDARGFLTEYAKQLRLPLEALLQIPGAAALSFQPTFSPATGAVQVIIPFKDRADVTVSCLRSLVRQDIAGELEVVLVDNGSAAQQRAIVDEAIASREFPFPVLVIEHLGYFNFAQLNNLGARRSVSPYILFLNNDVELLSLSTLSELRSWCAIEDAGVVGGALYYPNGNLQHGGINFSGVRPCNVTSPEQFSNLAREVNAVTFAMALVKRRVFDLVGGLDEFLCPNGFGDAVFCNEIRKQGYLVLYTPLATATHHESLSRGQISEELELYEMTQAGIPISDLFADMYARNQPTQLNLVQLQAHEEPLRRNAQPPLVARAGLSRIAHRVLRVVGG